MFMKKTKPILIASLVTLCGGVHANGQDTARAVNIPAATPVISGTATKPSDTAKPALQNDVVAATVSSVVVTYVHTDVLGSVIAETNASGVVIKTTDYKPFGESKDN